MTAFGADVPIAISRIHRPEIIAFDAIGTTHDFLNHCHRFASSASVSARLSDHMRQKYHAESLTPRSTPTK